MSDSADRIIVSPVSEELKNQCELLRKELAGLFAELDHLENTVGPNITAEYAATIGAKEYEALALDVEVRRLKATMEKILALENQNKKPNLEQIEAEVEDELKEWNTKVQKLLEDVERGKKRLASQMSPEDSAEMQKLYRELAKKLHPDINPDLSEEHKALWGRVQLANSFGDLDEMRALALLVDDIPDEIVSVSSLDMLRQRRDRLKEQVAELIRRIDEIQQDVPFTLAEKLADPAWIQSQVAESKRRIKTLSDQKELLQEWLESWKAGR